MHIAVHRGTETVPVAYLVPVATTVFASVDSGKCRVLNGDARLDFTTVETWAQIVDALAPIVVRTPADIALDNAF